MLLKTKELKNAPLCSCDMRGVTAIKQDQGLG